MEQNKNDIVKIDSNNLPTNFSDKAEIIKAENVVTASTEKELTFWSKFLPSDEDKAKNEKNIELIKQAYGDRNKIYAILKQTQLENFRLAANNFLKGVGITYSTEQIARLTTAVNNAITVIDMETDKFHETIQNKRNKAENWVGSERENIMKDTDEEINDLRERFKKLKKGLMDDLEKVRENLIK